jgi:hypothetical protein
MAISQIRYKLNTYFNCLNMTIQEFDLESNVEPQPIIPGLCWISFNALIILIGVGILLYLFIKN